LSTKAGWSANLGGTGPKEGHEEAMRGGYFRDWGKKWWERRGSLEKKGSEAKRGKSLSTQEKYGSNGQKFGAGE